MSDAGVQITLPTLIDENKIFRRFKVGKSLLSVRLEQISCSEVEKIVNSSRYISECIKKLNCGYSEKTKLSKDIKKEFLQYCNNNNISTIHLNDLGVINCSNCMHYNETQKNPISQHTFDEICRKCRTEANRKYTIDRWLKTGYTGYEISSTIRGAIRNYLYKEQNYRCAICGMKNIWNGKQLNFILDHKDGDASNNKRDNLRLICPNCDSQLDTYKSKNKNSARKFRRQSKQ